MDKINQKLEERLEKQRIASEKFQEDVPGVRLRWAPAATFTSMERFFTLRIDSREFLR